jgi:hypothetical protein
VFELIEVNKRSPATETKPRRLTPAPELYPQINFERLAELALSLHGARSDSAAVSRLLHAPTQVVHQQH